MSTKELQEKLVEQMKTWQKIEDTSVASTSKVIDKANNPLIKLVMEIIKKDSQTHHKVQQFVVDSIEKEAVTLTPEDMGDVWGSIEEHIKIEKKMVGNVIEALEALKGKKMVVQEYLLNYMKIDEAKHDEMLDALNKVKSGMYPYG